jgi:riboflavin biosynthesis pyrimidine reductase
MDRPRVICHMMSTIDGRIVTDSWGNKKNIKTFSTIYERCHKTFESQAWMVGRVTMEKHFADAKKTRLAKIKYPVARDAFIGDKNAKSFAIAVDAKGKLSWKKNEIDGDHIIELLTEQASNAYLHYLQQKNISYIISGKREMDFKSALKQLHKLFSIKTLMLEGGGNINGSLLNEGLIDELSLLIAPVADGTPQTPTTFDVSNPLRKKSPSPLHLSEVKQMEHDVLWLKYRVSSR